MKKYTTYQFNARLLAEKPKSIHDTYVIKIQVLAESLNQAEKLAYEYFKISKDDTGFIYSECIGLYPLSSNNVIIDKEIAVKLLDIH